MYKPEYDNSYALIVGINAYRHVSPLDYARNDAEGVARTLQVRHGFPQENIRLLLDEDATRGGILQAFLDFTRPPVLPDDRILFFFAGHGFTCSGHRGEVGYLVPVDGDSERLESLLRWDDLTRNADLIKAKHMIFIMDACYGGLALTRAPGPGSMRFLKDMIQRYARQVITAGKADEVVADAGGPIPSHSVFTGHLMQALEGAAATKDGILSANAVMAYVYEHVSKDGHSRQTPHFGFLDGDGDFIFDAPMLGELKSGERDNDVLIELPQVGIAGEPFAKGTLDVIQEYISDTRYRIKLDAVLTAELRKVLQETSDTNFPVEAPIASDDFAARLKRYEDATANIRAMISLLTYWGGEEHLPLIRKAVARLADNEKRGSGKVVWLALQWYPSMLVLYASGMAAIAAGRYRNLAQVLLTKVGSMFSSEKSEQIIISAIDADTDLQRSDAWKGLPSHERNYVPRSEYLFKVLQPELDDLFFLGRSYESYFDRFEILLALVYADLHFVTGARIWGPLGRFGWKYGGRLKREDNPYSELMKEAEFEKNEWPPLRSGLFQGSFQRFSDVSKQYETEVLQQLHWR